MTFGKHSNFDGLCERDRLNLRRIQKWAIPFFICYVLAALVLGPREDGQSIPFWRIGLGCLPFIPGYLVVSAYLKFAREADELIRSIMNAAAAKSFAVVVIVGFIYIMATQMVGEWKDSGAVLWAAGFLTYQVLFARAWRQFNV